GRGWVGIRGLDGESVLDLPIDSWVAELGFVRVSRVPRQKRRAGEHGVEEAGRRGVVGDPLGRSNLRARARVAHDLEVAGAATRLQQGSVAQRTEELHGVWAHAAEI